MTTILGVDPGKTCGLGVICTDPFHAVVGFEASRAEFVDALMNDWVVGQVDNIAIGVERFVIDIKTGKKSQQHDALEVIGSLEDACRPYPNVEFVRQQVSDAKTAAPDRLLKKFGLYVPGRRHANDGARHALLILIRSHAHLYAKIALDGYDLVVQRAEVEIGARRDIDESL